VRPGIRLLRISEVARRVGISSSALRAWEALGLVTPQRTQSRYRLYGESDVRLLQRAIFLRRARGLNPPAIVHVLKRQGVVSSRAEGTLAPGQRFRRLRTKRGLSLAQVAKATGVSVGFLSALERGQMRSSVATLRRIAKFYRTNILALFETAGEHQRLDPLPNYVPGGPQNPMGARAMYLYANGKDTLFRIHGTNQPEYIGHAISSGCIRLTNENAIDLYNRVKIGTTVVVLAPGQGDSPFGGRVALTDTARR